MTLMPKPPEAWVLSRRETIAKHFCQELLLLEAYPIRLLVVPSAWVLQDQQDNSKVLRIRCGWPNPVRAGKLSATDIRTYIRSESRIAAAVYVGGVPGTYRCTQIVG